MIIDFHTHTFPDSIAERAITKLVNATGLQHFSDGTSSGLCSCASRSGIDLNILLPVVTKPTQTHDINEQAFRINESAPSLLSFGGIHPDNENYREILKNLSDHHVKGIKLHPVFQDTYLDDIRYLRIIDCACEYDLIISVHAGQDISLPLAEHSEPCHILPVLKELRPPKMVLAHMGGLFRWDEAEEMLAAYPAYLDTSFSLPSPITEQNTKGYEFLSTEQFHRLTDLVGIDHVLFGTDSPWTDQASSIDAIRKTRLTEKEISRIFYENARDLLHLF